LDYHTVGESSVGIAIACLKKVISVLLTVVVNDRTGQRSLNCATLTLGGV